MGHPKKAVLKGAIALGCQMTVVPAAGATMWGCGWYIPVFITALIDDSIKKRETACKQTHTATEK